RLSGLRGIAAFEFGQYLMPLDHSAEHRVPAIQMRRAAKCQEELRAAGIGRGGFRHAEYPAKVLPVIRFVALAIDPVARAAAPRSFGTGGVSHKAGQHAVER